MLTPAADVSAASWITDAVVPWQQLAGFGPPGFEAYARLRFLPDPIRPGQQEGDVDDERPLEHDLLGAALDVLGSRTRTPDDCFFCVWEGWGRLIDGPPKVIVPNRECFLFQGRLADVDAWRSADQAPDGVGMTPAFVWPADHAWCVAKDVDSHFAGIGASVAAIDDLVADARLDAVLADPRVRYLEYG
jgi:hypothetical protein